MIPRELEYFELNEPWSFEEVVNGSMILTLLFSTGGIFFCSLFLENLENIDISHNNTKF